MSEYVVTDTELTAVANAIRTKGGTSADLEWNADFISAIEAISGGGGGGGSVHFGNTAPSASLGSDGDLYVQLMDLPTNVNFVEYLQSSGTQYIDTGIIGDQDTSFLLDYSGTSPGWRFGARAGAQSRALTVNPSTSSTTTSEFVDYGNVRDTYSSLPERRTISNKNHCLYINDTIKKRYGIQTFTTPSSLLLFAVHENNNVNKTGGFKIYRAVLWENDIPIADYLPCLDTNDVPCMWDNIAKEYVYNDGTGDFTYGSTVTPEKISDVLYEKKNGTWVVVGEVDDVNTEGGGSGDPSLPAEYQEVEYLICTGHEWITLASPVLPESYAINAVAKLTSYVSYTTIFGYRASSTNDNDLQASVTSNGQPTVFKRNRVNSIQSGGIGILDDGKLYYTVGNRDTRRTLYIGKYYNESDSSEGLPWNGCIYSVDIYDYKMSKIIKLVPCYRKSDDVIGFYDVYNNTFYPNEGTGAFGKGADVN